MAIVESTFAAGHAQADGRRYIVERHTDDAGSVHELEYLAAPDADHAAIMTARAAAIEAALSADAVATADVAAAREKLQSVLANAEQAGAISKTELELAGQPLAPEKGK